MDPFPSITSSPLGEVWSRVSIYCMQMQTGGKSVAKSFALICSHGAGMGGLGKPREYQAIMSGHPPSQAEKEDIEVVATPLHLAASLDDVDQAQAILANTHGFLMLEARDSDGHTPLIIAVRCETACHIHFWISSTDKLIRLPELCSRLLSLIPFWPYVLSHPRWLLIFPSIPRDYFKALFFQTDDIISAKSQLLSLCGR